MKLPAITLARSCLLIALLTISILTVSLPAYAVDCYSAVNFPKGKNLATGEEIKKLITCMVADGQLGGGSASGGVSALSPTVIDGISCPGGGTLSIGCFTNPVTDSVANAVVVQSGIAQFLAIHPVNNNNGMWIQKQDTDSIHGGPSITNPIVINKGGATYNVYCAFMSASGKIMDPWVSSTVRDVLSNGAGTSARYHEGMFGINTTTQQLVIIGTTVLQGTSSLAGRIGGLTGDGLYTVCFPVSATSPYITTFFTDSLSVAY